MAVSLNENFPPWPFLNSATSAINRGSQGGKPPEVWQVSVTALEANSQPGPVLIPEDPQMINTPLLPSEAVEAAADGTEARCMQVLHSIPAF